jgi:hypothetical protein
MSALNLFDYYNFRARLQPAFLALVPLAIGVFAWAPPGAKWATALWSLLGSAGFTFFLANLARNKGKQLEPELWKVWGGGPTTALLRHAGTANPVLRERWHQQLAKASGLPLPTIDQERDDPRRADEMYEAATRILIGKMRDTRVYPFVFRDNVNYGFCRNLLALRKLALVCAAIGLCASSGSALWSWKSTFDNYPSLGCVAVNVALLLWWLFTVNSNWVKVPAMNYAQHLFEGLEKLAEPKARKPKQAKTALDT